MSLTRVEEIASRLEPGIQCTWCGRMDLDCICEEISCLDLEDQLDELLSDEEVSRG